MACGPNDADARTFAGYRTDLFVTNPPWRVDLHVIGAAREKSGDDFNA
jgi:hypothetical protein